MRACAGACGSAQDIDFFCGAVQPGENRIRDCLLNQKNEELAGNAVGRTVSKDCYKELFVFLMDESTNINKDIPMAKACKKDVKKHCKNEPAGSTVSAPYISCLREVKDELTPSCEKHVYQAMYMATKDFRLDAVLKDMCMDNAKELCPEHLKGNELSGDVQECLRGKRTSLSWECQEELFRQEVENADDIRLSTKLFRTCLNDKKKFCKDVKPGNSRAKDCLEEHRNDPGFGAECKKEMETMMERRTVDFRLDVHLRSACEADISTTCGYELGTLDAIAGYDARVITCLQDYREELTTQECKAAVKKTQQRASEDIRFSEPLWDSCFEDRNKFCQNVEAGSARVIRCLQDHRAELDFQCKSTLFDQEVRMAESIDFNIPVKKACTKEIGTFCKDIPTGNAKVMECLEENVNKADMGGVCKAEIKRLEVRAGEDYRLHYRLAKACDGEIEELCVDECSLFKGDACGGTVLRCLRNKQANITSTECRNELFKVELIQVSDWKTDKLLYKACKADFADFCPGTETGLGQVHQCLRSHKDKLSDECRQEEGKLNQLQSGDVRLRPKLREACSAEINAHCKAVPFGKGRVFRCLENHLSAVDFSDACALMVSKNQFNMQQNYELDFGVRKQCKAPIDKHCARQAAGDHNHAEVLKCLVSVSGEVDKACERELARSVRNALWQYRKGASLTEACDADVGAFCAKASKNVRRGAIGAVGKCLAKQLIAAKPLAAPCRDLVLIAAPADAKAAFDNSLTGAAVADQVGGVTRMQMIQSAMVDKEKKGASMITLTGWFAMACLFAFVGLLLFGAYKLYQKYYGVAAGLGVGGRNPYTLVVKSGDV